MNSIPSKVKVIHLHTLYQQKKYKDKSKKSHLTFHKINKSHSAQIYIKKKQMKRNRTQQKYDRREN